MTAPLDEEPSLRSMQLMTIETNDSSDDDDYEDNDVGTPDYINDFQYQTEQYEQEEIGNSPIHPQSGTQRKPANEPSFPK